MAANDTAAAEPIVRTRVRLIVDATYELPVAFEVTKASSAEQPQAQRLLDQMQDLHPELLERCSRLSGR